MIGIDIEMPKSCTVCPLTYLDTGDDPYFGGCERRCVIDNSSVEGMTKKRWDDCPLSEVEKG